MTSTFESSRASRWYGPVIALNDVTASVGPGVTGLLGPNGAGKSTFLKLAAGQLAPSQGEVTAAGRGRVGLAGGLPPTWACARRADAFWERLTGAQFLMCLLRLTGFDDAECRRRATRRCTRSTLEAARDRKIGGYSKGMRQRIKLAQALAHDPDVLLLDEPLTGMDPVNRRRVGGPGEAAWRARGKTILVSSHILHEVEAMTRRVLLIHNGRILAEGDVREIRDLMDEHPHTVALRARDPRRAGARRRGRAARAVADLRRGRRVADRADGAARRVLRSAAARRRARPASARCIRPTRTWSRCSGTWWRGERTRTAGRCRSCAPRARCST